MRILTIHSDFIEFEPKKPAGKFAEEEIKQIKQAVNDCLVVFSAVEKVDERKISETAKNAVEEIRKICDQVKTKNIVLYPFAHLSNDLASPSTGLEVMKSMQAILEMDGYKVTRAPFGWYKAFTISCKGHPLSELSRIIGAVPAQHKSGSPGKATKRSAQELEEYGEHDHRKIGKEMDLFSFHENAPGQPFFHHRGFLVLEELRKFMAVKLNDNQYMRVQVPILWGREIFETSGHWQHYRDNLFIINVDGREFGIKPMNCPGHALIFKTDVRSYRDLPLRYAEWTTLYRNELSGVLSGLFRVLSLTQDDAHIYCREDQVEKEVTNVIKLMKETYSAFGFKYFMKLSTRPESRLGTDEMWDRAEDALKSALKANQMEFIINEADGAFYGPKIDVDIEDSLGRKWQCATIQLDYNQANRFDLKYIGEDGKEHRPVVIHRAIYGSFERFLGILIEHFDGKFPTWLAPVQAVVIPISDKNQKYAQGIFNDLRNSGIRAELHDGSETVQNRIRKAHTSTRTPYILVLGEKEESAGTVAVRTRDGKVKYGVKAEEFLESIKKEIGEKI